MEDYFIQFWNDFLARSTGPLSFRFILQPIMAALLGIRDGLKDARSGRPPYFWAVLTRPGQHWSLLKDGWKAVLRVFILGIVMDVIYQFIVFDRFRTLEALFTAFMLAFIPYLLVRGPVNRIVRWKKR